MMKFYFTNWQLRETHFSAEKIWEKSEFQNTGSKVPRSDAHPASLLYFIGFDSTSANLVLETVGEHMFMHNAITHYEIHHLNKS